MARWSKVEISGVNTSTLPVLSRDEAKALFIEAKAGSESARQTLIQGNLRLVLSVIKKFDGRNENPDDLFQVGCIGLIKGIDNFNPDMDVYPSTYLVPMILGEVRRYLRDSGSVRVSRSMRDTAYKVLQAKEKFIAEHQREPSVEEIAKILDIKREDVVFALDAIVDPRLPLRTHLLRRRGHHLRHGPGQRHPEHGRFLDRTDRSERGHEAVG